MISIFLESGYILFTFFENIIFSGENFTRSNIYKGFTGNINIAAFSLVAKSPAAFYYTYISKRLLNKSLGGILIFMTVSCLWITLSRGAFIAFSVIVTLMIVYSILKRFSNYILSSSILILPILISYLIFSNIIVSGDDILNKPKNIINSDR